MRERTICRTFWSGSGRHCHAYSEPVQCAFRVVGRAMHLNRPKTNTILKATEGRDCRCLIRSALLVPLRLLAPCPVEAPRADIRSCSATVYPIRFKLALSHAHTVSLTLSRSHCLALSRPHCFALSRSHCLALSCSHCLALSHVRSRTSCLMVSSSVNVSHRLALFRINAISQVADNMLNCVRRRECFYPSPVRPEALRCMVSPLSTLIYCLAVEMSLHKLVGSLHMRMRYAQAFNTAFNKR